MINHKRTRKIQSNYRYLPQRKDSDNFKKPLILKEKIRLLKKIYEKKHLDGTAFF